MRVYDCFSFYNEYDLLELRLRELADHVDFFVMVESDRGYTGIPKPYRFEQNAQRYQKWLDKIRYIKHKSSNDVDPWKNESAQRDAIQQGIQDANDDDIIIISDLDEIVRASSIKQILQTNQSLIFGLHMPLFNFKFNFMRVDPGPYEIWSMACRASWIRQHSPQKLRNLRAGILDQKTSTDVCLLQHSGWHFAYLGDDAWLRDKAINNCHQEDISEEFFQQLDVEKSIQEKKCWNRYWPYQYEIVDLDNYFPTACHDYPHHILPNSNTAVLDILQDHAKR